MMLNRLRNRSRIANLLSTRVTKHIVSGCVERGIGTIAAGNLKGIREDDETDEPRKWVDRGNEGLHGCRKG